jgi:hypothetical protein
MNTDTQKLLSGIAKCAGLTIEFPDGAPVRISGFQDDYSPSVLITIDQPDSELIFAILQKIGLVPVQSKPLHFPWLFNRPYKSEFAGEVAYRTRRTVRHNLNLEWRTGLWALCAYTQIGCPNELRDFLKRHPEKMKLMVLVWFVILRVRLVRFFYFPIRILGCVFAGKTTGKDS